MAVTGKRRIVCQKLEGSNVAWIVESSIGGRIYRATGKDIHEAIGKLMTGNPDVFGVEFDILAPYTRPPRPSKPPLAQSSVPAWQETSKPQTDEDKVQPKKILSFKHPNNGTR